MFMNVIIAAVILFVLGAVIAGYYFSRDNRIKRAMRAAPLVAARDFQGDQLARLQGTLRYATEPLTAPLSGRSCALYVVQVEEYRSNGKSGSWHEIIREEEGREFFLDDDSGSAFVRPDGADTVLVKDAHFRSGTLNDATPGLEAFLNRNGTKSTGWLFNRSLRYKEGVLEAGELVAVCGRGVREADPDPRSAQGGYRESATRVVLSQSLHAPLYISDDPSVLTG